MSDEPTTIAQDRRALLSNAIQTIEQLQAQLEEAVRPQKEPIAVIGMGCRFPGAANPERFWDLLREGRNAIREVPAERWSQDALYDTDPDAPGRMNTRWGGFLDPNRPVRRPVLRHLPAGSRGPGSAAAPPARGGLGGARGRRAAPAASRAADGRLRRHRSSDYARCRRAADGIDTYRAPGSDLRGGRSRSTARAAGPGVAVDTACSSSLVAVHLACQSLRPGECDLALAGGVNLMLSPDVMMLFPSERMISPDGRCKTFDAAADGFVRGEGCGVVVLKRLSDALADGDRILRRHPRLRRQPGWPQQRADGAQRAGAAGGDPRGAEPRAARPGDIGYVEAHGTGTSLGDPIEIEALGAVTRTGSTARPPLPSAP